MAISITDKAATKVQDYLKQVNDQNLALRVFVKAGGCAGYQFGLKLDKTGAADVIEHRNGVNIVADAKSADLLGDADRKSTRLNSSHITISYAVFCLKKKKKKKKDTTN